MQAVWLKLANILINDELNGSSKKLCVLEMALPNIIMPPSFEYVAYSIATMSSVFVRNHLSFLLLINVVPSFMRTQANCLCPLSFFYFSFEVRVVGCSCTYIMLDSLFQALGNL